MYQPKTTSREEYKEALRVVFTEVAKMDRDDFEELIAELEDFGPAEEED